MNEILENEDANELNKKKKRINVVFLIRNY